MIRPEIRVPVAIDPLSILLPEHIYVKIIEWLDPHVPLVRVIERAVADLTPEDREYIQSRVKQVKEYIEVVEKAIR